MILSCVGCTVSIGDPAHSARDSKEKDDDKDDKDNKDDDSSSDEAVDNAKDVVDANSEMEEYVLKDNSYENNDLIVEFADGWKPDDKPRSNKIELNNHKSSIRISASLNNAKDKMNFDIANDAVIADEIQKKDITLNGHKGYYFTEKYTDYTKIYLSYDKYCVIFETKDLPIDSKELLKQIEKVKFKKHSDYEINTLIKDDTYDGKTMHIKLTDGWKFDLDSVRSLGRVTLINDLITMEVDTYDSRSAKEAAEHYKSIKLEDESDMKEITIGDKKGYCFETSDKEKYLKLSPLFMETNNGAEGCTNIRLNGASINESTVQEQIKNITNKAITR